MVWKKSKDISEEGENLQSRINAAGLINSTLERLWMEAYTAMASGDFLKWNSKLDAIWIILGGDVNENNKEDKDIKTLDLDIYNLGNLSVSKQIGFEKKNNPNRSMQYQLLKKKSLYLRRLQNRQGKGTAYASDDEDDVD